MTVSPPETEVETGKSSSLNAKNLTPKGEILR